ncbi:MAG TPA: hypothetical protein VE441_05850, partial [Mycobacterium sp.]|nr:hypothetical protein [Mycobacterium sp.]
MLRINRLEISGNCDDPSFWLCAPEPAGVGTGGVCARSELDADGSTDTTALRSSGPVRRVVDDRLAGTRTRGRGLFFDPAKTYASYYLLGFFPAQMTRTSSCGVRRARSLRVATGARAGHRLAGCRAASTQRSTIEQR